MTKIIGLTGPSGAGKGAACAIFERLGIPAVDTDGVYHAILEKKGPCTDELVAAFGGGILGENGLVSRLLLRRAVFDGESTKRNLHTLNAITHKYIMADTHALIKAHAERGARAVVIDAPQLFEAGIEGECDVIVGVLAPFPLRKERLLVRDGLTDEAISARLRAQHDDDFFRKHCDVILENSGDLTVLEDEICRFLKDFGVK